MAVRKVGNFQLQRTDVSWNSNPATETPDIDIDVILGIYTIFVRIKFRFAWGNTMMNQLIFFAQTFLEKKNPVDLTEACITLGVFFLAFRPRGVSEGDEESWPQRGHDNLRVKFGG